MEPLVEEIRPLPDLVAAFRQWSLLPHCIFLDSSLGDARRGRYTFLAADPFDYVQVAAGGEDGLASLGHRLTRFSAPRIPDLPPFQGGAAGMFGYDLGRALERLPEARHNEFQSPAMACGLYDVVLVIDHHTDQAWLVSQGFPERQPERRRRRAAWRLNQMKELLSRTASQGEVVRRRTRDDVAVENLSTQFAVSGHERLTSNFSADKYLTMVEQAMEYIRAGDLFQVNVAQRLLHPADVDSVSLYLRLRRCNPAPFAGYFDTGNFQIVSASPERFLQVDGRSVEACPIKGTRPRTAWPEADLFAGDELEQSEKDRAENVMIVDLLRNDLSRVCVPSSVRVTQLCELETFQYVQHLVSAVNGTLADGCSPLDLIRAAFPGGSVTGAPKVRAMEIIAELEPTARGPYCGSLGYLGFDGDLDLSILIRTITAGRGWWQFPVGGGITAQSVPQREYEETWHKAEGLIRAVC